MLWVYRIHKHFDVAGKTAERTQRPVSASPGACELLRNNLTTRPCSVYRTNTESVTGLFTLVLTVEYYTD